ncbi:MAG: hypothetical protein ACREOJ_11915, partial [Gemmatimonadaceae bacterium]
MTWRRGTWSDAVLAGAAVMVMLGAVACSDQSAVSAPEAPVVPVAQPNVLGMVEGQVDANGKVTFTPVGSASGRLAPGVNASVYGTQGVNVLLYATPTAPTTKGASSTWTFNVGIQNLLAFPIGASQAGPVPSDTLGLYVAIISGPTAISGTCIACIVSFQQAGTGTFTAANQPYVYWHDRLTAHGGGKDTTTARLPFTFTAPKSVTGFRFTMIVGAAWPPPQQTVWSAYYNAAADSEPDLHGKPPWKQTFMAFPGGTAGAESWGSGALTLSGSGGQNIYFYRADSLAAATPAVIEANMQVNKNGKSQSLPEVVFGLADGARKLAMVGLSQNTVGFVRFAPSFLPTWGFISTSLSAPAGSNSPHTYQLQKFGADSVVLYVDGVHTLATTY